MSVRDDFDRAFAFQAAYTTHLEEIAQKVTRVRVASWEDDTRRNTDFRVMRLANDLRITARVRESEYRDRYRDQFTIRLDRPSGAPAEMVKMRRGDGDFGIYGFASATRRGRLVQWCLYNVALLRLYLDEGGRWYEQRNADGSSTFAVFSIHEVAGAEPGFVLNSEGLALDAWPAAVGVCRVCYHASWHSDETGPVHDCCALVPPGGRCEACAASVGLQHTRWGWPKQ